MPRDFDWDANVLNPQTINAGTAVVSITEVLDTSTDQAMLFEGTIVGLSTVGELVTLKAYGFGKMVSGALTMNVKPQLDVITGADGAEAALAGCVLSWDDAGGRVRLKFTGVLGKTINLLGSIKSMRGPG